MKKNRSSSIFIILLNYSGFEDTITCLQSLRKISYPSYNIVIVDNDSPDRSMEVIGSYLSFECVDHVIFNRPDKAMEYAGKLPFVTCIQSGRNGGYGHGNNIGIKYALAHNADYVLVLNNDTVVDPGFLEPLVAMCEADANIGIASAKIYFYDRPDVIWFNGGRFLPYTAKVEHVNFNEKDMGQGPIIENTFISGCLWLVPRKIFETVGLINEEYFMYVEDLEYCQRVLAQGYSLKVCNNSNVWHKVGTSTGGRFSEFSIFWRTKNMHMFIAKSSNTFWQKGISLLFFNLKQFVILIKSNNISLIKIQLKAIGSFITGKNNAA